MNYSFSKKRLLVIDDDEAICKIVRQYFERQDFQVAAITRGREVLPFLDSEPIHIVLLDIKLQDMDGLELLCQIRCSHPNISIIMITGNASVDTAVNSLTHGADDYITKPFDFPQMLTKVKEVIAHKTETILQQQHNIELERMVKERTRQYQVVNEYLEQTIISTIRMFSSLIEFRDPYIGSHSKRVTMLCKEICERMELKDSVRKEIEMAAMLHDIGKICIPDALLQKEHAFPNSKALSKKEQSIIQMHPIIGQEAVEIQARFKNIAMYIRQHHELFNGSGYPDSLAGYNISLGARIISVVDIFDRIAFCAPAAKRSLAIRFARQHIREYGGILYDLEISEHLLDVLDTLKGRSKQKQIHVNILNIVPGMVLSHDIYTTSGVLILSANEILDRDKIAHIRCYARKNLILNHIYVYEPAKKTSTTSKSGTYADQTTSSSPRKKTAPVKKTSTTSCEDMQIKPLDYRYVCKTIDTSNNLKTLPTIYDTVMKLLDDPLTTRGLIAEKIKMDLVITVRILRIVNSSLFAFKRRITTIEDAIPLLGFNEIRHIVTSVSVMSVIDSKYDFWKHSLACGLVSKFLGNHVGVQNAEEYFTGGILHDFGKLVMRQLFPKHYEIVLKATQEDFMPLRAAERNIFGNDHQFYGEYLMEKWKIPANIKAAVLYHHNPSELKSDTSIVSAVHIADIIVHMLQMGDSGERGVPKLDDFAKNQIDISLSDIEDIIPEIESIFEKNSDLFNMV